MIQNESLPIVSRFSHQHLNNKLQNCAADRSKKLYPDFPKTVFCNSVPWIIDLTLIGMNHNWRLEITDVRSRITFGYPCYSFIIEPCKRSLYPETYSSLQLHILHDHKDSFFGQDRGFSDTLALFQETSPRARSRSLHRVLRTSPGQ